MREQQLQDILRHMPAGVATLQGPELRYGFVNEAMQSVLGSPITEGQSVMEQPGIIPADLLEVMQQVYQRGQPYVAKAYCLPITTAPDTPATQRYYDVALEPVREGGGPVSGLLLFAMDVTGQEEARQRTHELAIETRRLDTRLRVLTETVPQITFTVDAEGTYEYVSPQWYYFTGQPPMTDLNAIWPLLIHPDDRLRVLYQTEAARSAGVGWSYEYRLRRHDGQYRWMLSRALPELHAPDKPVFWHGALTEIHDQRELSEALRRGEAELRFLADSIPELIWTATAEGFIDYYNKYSGEYSGLTGEELGPAGWISLLAPTEQAGAARRWIHSIATGESYEGLYRMRRHDGRYRWHIIRARQLTDARGLRWFGACTDVDDQHRLRQVLQTQYDELARTNRDLDTFVYTASHDLKQPLLNLRGLFDELRRSASFDDPQEAEIITMVDDALHQLELTLQDLAATVQDQRGLSAPAEPLDLRSVTEEVLLGLRTQVQESGAVLELDFEQAPTLTYGRANLRSILHNLLSNALKFAHPERVPHVLLRSIPADSGNPLLIVQDNGRGMVLPEEPALVFQPFTRQHPQIGGAGVGMYLVQRIISSRGGHLEVASVVDEGTTFTIHWFDALTA
ncbi:PAS domain-containing sensor histidine kinase [Hymenobacter sp. BT186]|uniref:histidine kinase n=1 Tax=Hymenobacter telluris TaxID=2816474 RepID=A0A939EUA8_9BACT|nr:PAS domain-containing sensor histidine kinase [Hymenobacter telluris]MBO0356825.1 PAS domain-containing sensor histidine kinase [Hymenobacter telluris]MBW3372851.1 PAS domain-containing sensor histidine kinase [Hymenobacter norwichensis]